MIQEQELRAATSALYVAARRVKLLRKARNYSELDEALKAATEARAVITRLKRKYGGQRRGYSLSDIR